MHKYYFWLVAFLISTKLFSQSYEIGVSVLSYTTVNQNSFQKDTLDYIRQKNRRIEPVLIFNYITKKQIDVSVQTGFFYSSPTIHYKAAVPINYSVNQKATSVQKSTFFKIGIAKRFYKERLILISGLNIPFQYCYYKKENYYSSTYLRDTIQSIRETHTINAPEYTTGLNFQQSVYYPLTKHLYLGMDLNLGLRVFIINGSRIDQSSGKDYMNAQNNFQTEAKIEFHHSLTSNLYFQPSISFKYNFKKENEK